MDPSIHRLGSLLCSSSYTHRTGGFNGHPNVTGAVDGKILCNFQKNGVCDPTISDPSKRPTYTEYQRAVRSKMVYSQLNNSLRSAERAYEGKQKRIRQTQSARCARLVETK